MEILYKKALFHTDNPVQNNALFFYSKEPARSASRTLSFPITNESTGWPSVLKSQQSPAFLLLRLITITGIPVKATGVTLTIYPNVFPTLRALIPKVLVVIIVHKICGQIVLL